MTNMMFSSIEYMKKLEATGLTQAQSMAISEGIEHVKEELQTLATKEDIASVKEEVQGVKSDVNLIKQELKDLRNDLHHECKDMQENLYNNINDLRIELRDEIKHQGTELRQLIDHQGADLRQSIKDQGGRFEREMSMLRSDMNEHRDENRQYRNEILQKINDGQQLALSAWIQKSYVLIMLTSVIVSIMLFLHR